MKNKVGEAANAEHGYTAALVDLHVNANPEEKLEIISTMREKRMSGSLIDDVQAETVPASENPKCLRGEHWDEVLEACVPN